MALTFTRPLLLASCLAALTTLTACQDKHEPATSVPLPIIENNRLRYPAEHPQLKLLVSVTAKSVQSLTVELPARLVWNEEKTQRIYPAFAGRVGQITADVGQHVVALQPIVQTRHAKHIAQQLGDHGAQARVEHFYPRKQGL